MSTKSDVDPTTLKLLVCPVTKAPLTQIGEELWCSASASAYPIVNGKPLLLSDSARTLSLEEVDRLRNRR
ncbi:MAG: Trm112 family protein [Gammaproteobacteria bacterium]|nr:Trm112 family protein [Gammaproteobacteria bacterium]